MNAQRAALILVLLGSATAVYAKSDAPTVDDKVQAACYPDVERLCPDAIPDEDKVRTCMEGKRAMVSPKCKEAYKAAQK